MTLYKRVHDPILGNDQPSFKGSLGRLQVVCVSNPLKVSQTFRGGSNMIKRKRAQ